MENSLAPVNVGRLRLEDLAQPFLQTHPVEGAVVGNKEGAHVFVVVRMRVPILMCMVMSVVMIVIAPMVMIVIVVSLGGGGRRFRQGSIQFPQAQVEDLRRIDAGVLGAM